MALRKRIDGAERRRISVVRRLSVVVAMLAAIVAAFGIVFEDGEARLPDFAADRIEASVSRAMRARLGAEISLGDVVFEVGRGGRARLVLRDVRITDPTGAEIGQFNGLSARLEPGPLLRGDFVPVSIRLAGAQITVRRDRAGRFAFGFERAGATAIDVGQLLEAVDIFFARPALAELLEIDARDLTVTLEDARSGRLWQATGARALLQRRADGMALSLGSEIFNGTEDLARLELTARTAWESRAARIGLRLIDWPARDIALQSPALAFLGVLDAPISGAVRAGVAEDGSFGSASATLEIGQGALAPAPGAEPIPFETARAYFDYLPASGRVAFTEVSLESRNLTLTGEGHALLEAAPGAWPESIVGQLRLTEGRFEAGELIEVPVEIAEGTVEARLELAPFALTIGQATLSDGATRVRASGRISADEAGWRVALDAGLDGVEVERALALWPAPLTPGLKRWLDGHLHSGRIADFDFGLRTAPEYGRRLALDFDFRDAALTPVPTMPRVTGASGRASLAGETFTLALETGEIAGSEGPVDVAGTVFQVPDLRPRPVRAIVDIRAAGPIDATMAVLAADPVRLLERTGLVEDGTEGTARAAARLELPLKDGIRDDEIAIAVAAELKDLATETAIPDRRLTAERLLVEVTGEAVSVTGPVEVDGVPATARLERALGEGTAEAPVRITADVSLDRAGAETFGIDLPAGLAEGRGAGRLALTLARGAPPAFSLTSDLVGIAMRLDGTGWAKPAGTPGRLAVAGRLGATPEVDRLEISAPGLEADGRLVTSGERITGMEFSRVSLGGWLDAPVRLAFRAGRPPAIRLPGGSVDIRALPGGGSESASGSGGDGVPVAMALDRLIVSDTIALAPFEGDLTPTGGLSGRFRARVNGGAPVSGTLIPTSDGTAIRIVAGDAGSVLRDAGLFRNVAGGAFDLILMPTAAAGVYEGQLLIENTRLRNNPTAAALLDAISIVGILDQLQGPGILFDTVDAKFLLTPREVRVREAAAVGASIGISLDGLYDLVSRRMDMQGVISPIYLINGIGSILTRRGEGLFGISYRMEGSADAPVLRINPLSLLTPGMLREIFRRPMPETGALSDDAEQGG